MRVRDGQTVPEPTQITVDGVTISNPREEDLVAAGYLPYEPPKQSEISAEELAAAEALQEAERPVTAAEFAELVARVTALEKAAGLDNPSDLSDLSDLPAGRLP